MPVAVDQRVLAAQQLQRRLILLFVELVWIADAELRLGGLQEQRRVGDVDRAVVSLHPALVALAVRQVLLLEDHRPAVRRRREGFGVVHQQVRPPLVRRAVGFAVHGVPGAVQQARIDVLPVRDQRGVDRLHPLAEDQAQRGVAGGGHQIVAALGHQADHFIRGGGGLHVHRTAGLLLKLGDPVVVFVGLAAFDVAGPGDDIQPAFAFAQRLRQIGRLGQAAQHGKTERGDGGGDCGSFSHRNYPCVAYRYAAGNGCRLIFLDITVRSRL